MTGLYLSGSWWKSLCNVSSTNSEVSLSLCSLLPFLLCLLRSCDVWQASLRVDSPLPPRTNLCLMAASTQVRRRTQSPDWQYSESSGRPAEREEGGERGRERDALIVRRCVEFRNVSFLERKHRDSDGEFRCEECIQEQSKQQQSLRGTLLKLCLDLYLKHWQMSLSQKKSFICKDLI